MPCFRGRGIGLIDADVQTRDCKETEPHALRNISKTKCFSIGSRIFRYLLKGQ